MTVEAGVYDVIDLEGVTILRGTGELSRVELEEMSILAAEIRRGGRRVVVDLRRVTHLHYAGAAHLKSVPGLRAAIHSRYVRDLVHAGGAGGFVEVYDELEEALRAA